MQPCESVAEFVVDVTVQAEARGFADHFADAYDGSALRAANDAELAAVPDCGEACLERTYQVHGVDTRLLRQWGHASGMWIQSQKQARSHACTFPNGLTDPCNRHAGAAGDQRHGGAGLAGAVGAGQIPDDPQLHVARLHPVEDR